MQERASGWLVGLAVRLGRRLMGWALRRSDDAWIGYRDNVARVLWDELAVEDKIQRDDAARIILDRIFG